MLRMTNQEINEKLKISFVSVPFSGHLKILAKLAKSLKKENNPLEVTFVITGWDNVKISKADADGLRKAGIKIVELNQGEIQGSQPMTFTFPRATVLTDQVIAACKESDYIIYDFFAIEGYIAGKKLAIPAICSIPAIMGPFDPTCALLKAGIEKNAKTIKLLEEKYGIAIASNIEMASDGFLIPSDYQNIQWSWPKFIKTKKYNDNRNIKNYLFMRPEKTVNEGEHPLIKKLQQTKGNKKIIYVSLGTVITGNLWNNVPNCRGFIKNIFNNIVEKFGHDERYEVVVATGRKISDLFGTIPSNFHIYESVPQQEILALSDVFVTHGGGNSVNEAIDAEIPMVVIPFFGDQHLCADNVAKLNIGVTFAGDEANKDNMVDTESCHLERASMTDPDVIAHAIEKVLSDPNYKNNIRRLKTDKPLLSQQLGKILVNDKTLNWQEGDLLYGCNDDRKKLAAMTGRTDFYRLCNTKSFSTLFDDLKNKASLPRIIDQYHDVLTNMAVLTSEIHSDKFNLYRETLKEYQNYISPYIQKLESLKDDHDGKKHDDIIWDMCLAGLSFFLYQKQQTIHFVVGKFNDQINLATRRELAWVKNHWQDDIVKQHVKFYVINNGKLLQMDPEKTNWFRERPTPTFEDVNPGLIDKNLWDKSMQLIRAHKQHLFFNHLPERYQDELVTLKASGLQVIDMQKTPRLAKQSLSAGTIHIFAIQKNGKATLVPKSSNEFHISHAVVAGNEPVISAGEVRLRSICVNGKWLKVIDLSNESGHYLPNATGLPQAIKAFEGLGYIVHRVNAIHIKTPGSFNKVEDSSFQFKSLTKAREI